MSDQAPAVAGVPNLDALLPLINAAAEAAVHRAFLSTITPVIQHGTVTEINPITWIHKVQMDGDTDTTQCHDITRLGVTVGSRVTVLFAPPHQGLIIGGPRFAAAWQRYPVQWACPAGNPPAVGDGQLDGWFRHDAEDCQFFIWLNFGSTTNGGTTEWRFTLPVVAATDAVEQFVLCKAFTNGLAQRWSGWGFIPGAGATGFIYPHFPGSTSQVALFGARNTDGTGAAGTGIPQVAGNFTWQNGHNFWMGGHYKTRAA